MRKRIPTLLALTLLIAVIAFGLFLYQVQKKKTEVQKSFVKPVNIATANITDTSAAIIWHTETAAIGRVITPEKTVADDRDDPESQKERKTHFVTLTGLTANTKYQVQIENNGYPFPEQTVTFTTTSQEVAEKASITPGYQPVIGTVLTSAQQPADEAIIILNAKDLSPKATFVTTAGNFILPTTKLINQSQTDTLQLPAQLPATLEIRSGSTVSLAQIIIPIKDHILPAVTLGKNENFMAFLTQPAPSPIALEFTQRPQNFDLNNDGKVNALDSSVLLDLIANQEFENTADFNTDNKIDDNDLDLIKQNLE